MINSLAVLTNGSVLKDWGSQGVFLSTDGGATFQSVGVEQIIPYGMQFQKTDFNGDSVEWLWCICKFQFRNIVEAIIRKRGIFTKGLAINPYNSNIWLLGSYSSYDGGQNWTTPAIEAIDGAGDIIFSTANPNYVVAVDNEDVARSTDVGFSWKLINSPIPGVSASHLVLSPTDPNVMLAYGTSYVDIVRTDDGGVSWYSFQSGIPIPLTGTSLSDIEYDPQNNNLIYSLIGGSLYSLLLPSTTWTSIYSPSPD